MLLGALCRLVDPLLRARSDKQWQAVAAYRELGHQQAVARDGWGSRGRAWASVWRQDGGGTWTRPTPP